MGLSRNTVNLVKFADSKICRSSLFQNLPNLNWLIYDGAGVNDRKKTAIVRPLKCSIK